MLASLNEAHLGGAELRAANLRGANLEGCTGLTSDQLSKAILDEHTKLPPEFQDMIPAPMDEVDGDGPAGDDENPEE